METIALRLTSTIRELNRKPVIDLQDKEKAKELILAAVNYSHMHEYVEVAEEEEEEEEEISSHELLLRCLELAVITENTRFMFSKMRTYNRQHLLFGSHYYLEEEAHSTALLRLLRAFIDEKFRPVSLDAIKRLLESIEYQMVSKIDLIWGGGSRSTRLRGPILGPFFVGVYK